MTRDRSARPPPLQPPPSAMIPTASTLEGFMRHFIIGTIATAIAFAIVQWLLPQVNFDGTIPQLIIVAIVFGVVNGIIKPVVKLLSFPITAMTLGLFSLVINAALFLLVARS